MPRIQTNASRVIGAPRADVWAVAATPDCEEDPGLCQHIVGAPKSGVGARHVILGPPAPPHGIRTVMFSEVVAELDGHWRSVQTHGGAWEHEETWFFTDAPDGETLVRISGWHLRPSVPAARSSSYQAALDKLAMDALDRLADRVAAQH
ncbi:SRPBCC family protein [Cellulomonas sp.]|uniref:SRPBCC family protein n=1 Tax=Cellulomonas sp. TaxID=40001 RepID=UPI001B2024CC|nr:SRPBCC family protein [Cellulomonas sp.]MBO9555980.1 SRPBCC family protein [Cellulomonas sp.]